MARITHTKTSPAARLTLKFKFLLVCTSLIAPLLVGITAGITPAKAVITNPTPTCSGATCIINFTSTNDYYAWNAPVAGTYTFEVWGGQGGTPGAATGKGGYAKGNKVMTAGTTLYIYVGGAGVFSNSGAGGFNGGGTGSNGGEMQGGGGGATHIGTAVGLLSTLSGNQASVYLVAGGGGGGDDNSQGGAGGGTAGTDGTTNTQHNGRPGRGATQSAGACALNSTTSSAWKATCGVFGKGGAGANYYGAGGGGGWYGGGGAEYDAAGGGGSGYVGGVTSTTLTAGNASMPNPAGGTMTGRTGVGYARVTYPNGPAVSTFTTTQTTPTNTTSSFSFSITMSEVVTGMAASDFSNAGTATGCQYALSGSGSSYTLTLSSCSEGTVTPQLLATSILGSSTGQTGPSSNTPTTTPVTIDRTAPSISSITAPANATYIPAGQINFTANMSESVIVTGTPRIAITIGTTTRYANYVSGSGTANLLFRYTVATDANDIDADGIVAASPIELNGGTMADAATNVSARTFTPPTLTSVFVAQVPGAPTITAITTTSGALSVAFTAGASNGSAITNYQYSLNGGSFSNRQTGTTASPIAITGLVNGTAYTVAIRAVNAAGAGAASTTSPSVTVNAPLTMVTPTTLTTSYGTPATRTLTSSNGTGTKSYAIKRTSDNSQVSGITVDASTGVVSVSSSTLPGTYGMTATVTDAANATSSANFNIVVNAAGLTITAASPSAIFYGGTKAADTFTATGLNAADSISGITYTYTSTGSTALYNSTTAPTAAGTYAITPSAATFVGGDATAAKYLTPITYIPGSFTINKKALTVAPTANQSISYGSSPSLTLSVSGFIAGESDTNASGYSSPTCAVSTYSVTSIAGSTHTITCSGGAANNYTFITSATETATVIQATLTVTPEAKSVNYGDAAPTYTFNVNGFRNSQNAATAAGYFAPSCTSSYTRTSPALTPVTITCSGGTATNYIFNTTATASITIAKISTLTITAGSPSAISYGSATPANSFSASGKAETDVISGVSYRYAGTGSTTYASNTQAPVLPGTYSITPSAATFSTGLASNYTTIAYVAGTFTINKAGLTIAGTPQLGLIYGTTFVDTFTATGLNAADSISGLTYSYTGTGSTTYGPSPSAPTAVGTYALTPSAATFTDASSAAKYGAISYLPGSLSIVKAPLQLVPETATVVYGSALSGLTFTVTGLQYGQTLSSIAGYVAPTCTSAYTTSTQVALSPVAITCSGGSASNYTFTTGTLDRVIITKRPISISGTTIATRPYNGTAAAGAITVGTVSGYAPGESLPITATAADYSSAATGSYSTTVTYALSNNADSSKGLANNYSIGTSTVTGQIVNAQPGFNVSLSQGASTAFEVNYGSSETLTITSTTATAGTVNFKVSINGGTAADIPGCSAVTITTGAAVCPWANPTVGKAVITISLNPTNANEAVDPKVITTLIVARPFITSFQVRGQAGVTSGAPGSVVVITGGNFTGITDIKFGTVSAEKTFRATSTQATVTVPFGATTGLISITTLKGGTGTSTSNFTVTG